MTYAWEDLEGVSLADEYGLDQWLGSEPSGAFFATSVGPERQRAVLKLVAEDPSAPGVQLAMWQRARELAHPNLMSLLDCGRTDYGGDSFVFAVFEAPDDSLTAAIQNGPLSEEEARDLLAAAIDALHYLHTRGWAHTSIDAEHVVAVGDRIKLASDTLWDDADQTAQSQDVWALGALIHEVLTGRRIGPGEAAGLSGISDPLRTVVQHALDPEIHDRWTVAEIAEALDAGRAGGHTAATDRVDSLPADGPRLPAEQPIAAAGRELRDHGPSPSVQVHEPFSNSGREEATHLAPPEVPSAASRFFPIAAAAAVALLTIVFVAAHHATPAPPAVAIVPPAVTQPPVVQPAASVIPASAPRQPLPSWRVIAYTYARHQDAEKKVQSINSRIAGIHAEVFSVGSSYLVSLGAHMTREDAAVLQRKAIGKGLPHDTYIQNFRSEE